MLTMWILRHLYVSFILLTDDNVIVAKYFYGKKNPVSS